MFRLVFYTSARGESPVEALVSALPENHRAKVAVALGRLAEHGSRLGRPEVDHLDGKIWELRVPFGGLQYRILFAHRKREWILLLSAFVKKTQAVPHREIRTAQMRLVEFERRMDRGEVR